jgi:hypothetical protein
MAGSGLQRVHDTELNVVSPLGLIGARPRVTDRAEHARAVRTDAQLVEASRAVYHCEITFLPGPV